MTNPSLKMEKIVPGKVSDVFRYWTDPESLKVWHCGTIVESVMDLKVGGQFLIRFEPEQGCDHQCVRGTYRTVQAPNLLEYSWKWDGAEMEDSVVRVQFSELQDGNTRIELDHSLLPDPKSRDDHKKGWEDCLSGMASFVSERCTADIVSSENG